MAAGIGNPLGAVQLFDNGAPSIISGYARTNISGGALVYASGATDCISSGANSFVTTDIVFIPGASGAQFNGIALYSAGSNTPVAVATKGTFILLCDGTVTNGYPVICAGVNAVRNFVGTGSQSDFPIGRALSDAGSETYALIEIL